MTEETQNMALLRWFRTRLARMFGSSAANHNGMRDYGAEFGYPSEVTPQDLLTMYLRNGIASRLVRGFAAATWEDLPVVRDEAGDSSEETLADGKEKNPNYSPFVKAAEDFFEAKNVLGALERADRLSGIGRYGVLLMGFKDGEDLSRPLAPGSKPLTYLQSYSDPNIQITRFVQDRKDARYGLPEYYNLKAGNVQSAGMVVQQQVNVHFSRVLHIAEFLDENNVYGTPRMLPVFNWLLDLQKVVGSSSESVWGAARPTTAFTADADADIDSAALEDMKEQALELEHQMRRTLALQGVTAQMLNATLADTSPHVDKLLDLISGSTGMPKRILTGSERGELGGDNDQDNWASRIDERQNKFATPTILVPFTQKMIDTGNLPKPQGQFWVEWPESNALSPMQIAERNLKRAQTLTSYTSSPTAELIVPPQEFRRDFLDLPPESEYEVEEEEPLDEEDPDVQDQFEDEEVDEKDERPPQNNVRWIPRSIPRGNRRPVVNAKPRTLYVRRNLLNADELRQHFRAQGLKTMAPAEEMHVTLAYSKTPLDWMKVGDDWTGNSDGGLDIPPGGVRLLELFGREEPKNVLVQLFSSSMLSWRHEDIKKAGAQWDFPSFEPHVTITYNFAEQELDFDALKPFTGALHFGPEIWETLVEDWGDNLKENHRA